MKSSANCKCEELNDLAGGRPRLPLEPLEELQQRHDLDRKKIFVSVLVALVAIVLISEAFSLWNKYYIEPHDAFLRQTYGSVQVDRAVDTSNK